MLVITLRSYGTEDNVRSREKLSHNIKRVFPVFGMQKVKTFFAKINAIIFFSKWDGKKLDDYDIVINENAPLLTFNSLVSLLSL